MLTPRERRLIRLDAPGVAEGICKHSGIHRTLAALLARKTGRSASDAAWQLYRASNLRTRAPGLVVIGRNGSSKRTYRCVICGWEGGSYCSKWPRTIRSVEAVQAHIEDEIQVIERLAELVR